MASRLALRCDMQRSERAARWPILDFKPTQKVSTIHGTRGASGRCGPDLCSLGATQSSDSGTTSAQGASHIQFDPTPAGPTGLARIYWRRHVRVFQAQHRGLSQSGAGDPGNHGAIRRPVCRGDGALLHDPDRGRPCRDTGCRCHSLDLILWSVLRPRRVPISVDYYFALTQTAINLQQNVSLPGGVTAQIQGTSLVGEIFRYELVGPPHFGLSNLRTVQDWILQRRLLSVPGVVQVNTWGGTTKEYDVDVDLEKLEAYGIMLPQVISAIGNANIKRGRSHHQRGAAIREYSRNWTHGQWRRNGFDPGL